MKPQFDSLQIGNSHFFGKSRADVAEAIRDFRKAGCKVSRRKIRGWMPGQPTSTILSAEIDGEKFTYTLSTR